MWFIRFTALGWDVVTIDGADMHAITSALDAAKRNKNGKPSLIIAKTIIGKVFIILACTSIVFVFIFHLSSTVPCRCRVFPRLKVRVLLMGRLVFLTLILPGPSLAFQLRNGEFFT